LSKKRFSAFDGWARVHFFGYNLPTNKTTDLEFTSHSSEFYWGLDSMRKHHVSVVSIFLCLSLISPVIARGQQAQSPSPLLGRARKGDHEVGFRVLYKADYSRTVRSKRDYTGKALGGERARQVRIRLWYPTESQAVARMHFEDYQFLASQTAFAGQLSNEQKEQQRESFRRQATASGASLEQVNGLLQASMQARKDAPFKSAGSPLIIGWHVSEDLAEYLAGHGYVVAEASGAGSETGLLDYVQDLEFAINALHEFPSIDFSRIGAIGFSASAAVAALLQMKSSNIDAVVSFDGTEAWKNGKDQMVKLPFARSEAATVPYLRFHNDSHNPATLDFTFFYDKARYMEFTRIDLKNLGHRDSGAVIEDYLLRNLADESSKPLLAYHQLMLEHIFHFFQAHLNQDAAALAFLKRSVIENRSRADGISIQHREALPVPPNRSEITAVLEREGAAGLQKLYQTLKVKDSQPFTESALRSVGIDYAFRRRNYDIASAVFNLMIEIYPQRCAAYFYAGVVYRNNKQTDLAIKSFEKFFAVKANDPFTSAEEKESLSVSAQEYLNGLKAQ
jgi:tetratricopeptide (TPR) repeat protein